MKNTNRNDYKQALKDYLEPIIRDKIAQQDNPPEPENIYTWVVSLAKSEVPHEFKLHGMQSGLASWLRGLGMNIDFSYPRIIQIASRLHECKLSEKEKKTVCEKWFTHIAFKILQFSDY